MNKEYNLQKWMGWSEKKEHLEIYIVEVKKRNGCTNKLLDTDEERISELEGKSKESKEITHIQHKEQKMENKQEKRHGEYIKNI